MQDAFQAGHLEVLERVAAGAPLSQLLDEIVRFIERQSTGMMCSILLLDADNQCVRHGAAPSLPPEFVHLLDGARIGPKAGSCGVAAYAGKRIIVSDIATHPNWKDYRHFALPFGLRACWSNPIFSPEKEILGTFAMYYREIREPNDQEIHWVEVGAHLASIAILRDRSEQLLRSSEQRARELTRLYAVSNGINETIVRVRDPQELYNFACQIAVEHNLARQAWVGLLVKANETMRVKARCGPRTELLDSLELSMNDERLAQGPVVRAMKTGLPTQSNDIANDRNFTLKDLAAACGVKSCAVFPIKVGGRAIGLFALGADQVNYFRSEEIQVLTTLAADISLAVESIVNERERHRAEETLRANEALRALVYSSVEDVIFYLSVEGPDQYRFLSVNPAFLQATGLAENEVVGKPIREVVPAESLALVLQKYKQAISQHAKVSWEEISSYPTGVKYGKVTICPIFDGDGRCTNLVGTVHDITELKIEAERRSALETQLHHAHRLQSLGTLAGGIAHDFNNLLSALSISIDTALLEAREHGPSPDYLKDIQKTVNRATGLVRQIMTFGRCEPPQRETVDLRKIIEEAMQVVQTNLGPNVQTTIRYDADTPAISADPTQMYQIVMNLCLNAAYALGFQKGKIDLQVDIEEQDTDLTKAPVDLTEGRYVRLSVTDDGCGMDEATVKRVFEPFFTTKPPDKGTGLGLSVVQGIVKGHNGAIDVKSELGRGTTFTVYLPITQVEKPETPSTPEFRATPGQEARLLVVDDDEALALLLPRALRRLGYQVTGHTNPLAALEEFRSRPQEFDLILTDIAMPGLTGPELAKKARLVRPDIPIVMLSGYIRPEDRETAEKLHINKLLYKPSSIAELSEILSEEISAISSQRTETDYATQE